MKGANLAIYAKILQEPDQSHSNQYHKLMRERYLLRLGPRRRIYHPHINSISSTVPTILEEGGNFIYILNYFPSVLS